MKKEKIKKRKTYDLRLTRTEVAHLRDLFSVVLPPDVKKTLSQHLAELEDRSFIEEKLWDKVADLCNDAAVPLDDEAPDYIVAPAGPPPMSVFHLSSDSMEDEEEEQSQEDSED
jgi:hypothetical protein